MYNKNITFTIIKPTAIKENFAGEIFKIICKNNFKIIALKMVAMTKFDAQKFYLIHNNRPFYDELCNYMSSSRVIVAVLEKGNAVNDFRKLIGNTNPIIAEVGTIRNLYGKNTTENAIHGSDSDENALIESNFFFNNKEIFYNNY